MDTSTPYTDVYAIALADRGSHCHSYINKHADRDPNAQPHADTPPYPNGPPHLYPATHSDRSASVHSESTSAIVPG